MAAGVLVVLLFVLSFLAGVDRTGEEEGAVHGHSVEFRAASTACRSRGWRLFAARDVWFVVSVPDLPRERAWLVVRAGRRVHGALGHRVWGGAERLAGVAARSRTARRRDQGWRARSAFGSLR